MDLQQIANFNGLANGARATAEIPTYPRSLARVQLQFGGSLTKATITELVMKIGSRTFFGPITAADLDKVMKYRGQFDHANFLDLDLCERDGKVAAEMEVGAIDMSLLGSQRVYVEVLNNAVSSTPTLTGLVGYVGRQFLDRDGDGKPNRHEQLMHKLLRYSLPNTGTRYVWQPVFGGAQIKRVHFMYTGTDWTSSANGNLVSVECKRNGVTVHDRIPCLANRFHQQRSAKVPQSRVYTLDFVGDNNFSQALNTIGARSLEFTLELAASDNVTAYVECLDVPNNL